MKNIVIILGMLLVWAVACKKEKLPPVLTESPVFTLKMTVDGEEKQFVGGEQGIYHFTGFEFDETNEVYSFKGAFAAANCPSLECPNTLIFNLKSAEKGVFSDGSIPLGDLKFRESDPAAMTFWRVKFLAKDGGNQPNYQWSLDAGVEKQGAEVEHIYETDTPRSIQLTATSSDGFTSFYKKPLNFQGGTSCPDGKLQLTPHAGVPGYDVFFIMPGPYPVTVYLWDHGLVGPYLNLDKNVVPENYAVTFDNFGCTLKAGFSNIQSPFTSTVIGANFETIVKQDSTPVDQIQLGRAVIQWIDNEGVEWRSDRFSQSESIFKILEKTDYELNEKGEKTLKLRVSFDCKVFRENGKFRQIKGAGVIAVARP